MGYRWIEHTAELELLLDCATEAGVFEDALRAFAELVDDAGGRESVVFDVAVSAPDRAALLAAWLEELVFRAETADLVPDALVELQMHEGGLRARVRGHRGRPRHIVKGVTYHRLRFDRGDDGYEATLVLDV